MKKLTLIILSGLFVFSCGTQKKPEKNITAVPTETSVSVDDLYAHASDLVDKEVTVKGTVLHVCKEGGARCFLMGSADSITIRVEAGAGIGSFTQEQLGSDLEIVGILKEVKTEAEAHNPGQEKGDVKTDSITNVIHDKLADNQAVQKIVYYIDGMKIK